MMFAAKTGEQIVFFTAVAVSCFYHKWLNCMHIKINRCDLWTSFLLVFNQVFKNLQLFLENKQPEDDLFDRLNVRNMSKSDG